MNKMYIFILNFFDIFKLTFTADPKDLNFKKSIYDNS